MSQKSSDFYFLQHETLLWEKVVKRATETFSTCNAILLRDKLHESTPRITSGLLRL